MGEKKTMEFLSNVPAFSCLAPQEIEILSGACTKKRYSKGQFIFWSGDRVERFHVVKSGVVEVYKSDPEGRKLVLWRCHPNDIFCLATLFVDSAFATAEAVEDSELYLIPKHALDRLMAQAPLVGANMLRCLSGKLACYSGMVDDLAFRDLTFRLMKLIYQSRRQDRQGRWICSLSLEEMASKLGTCKEVVSRSLKGIKEDGYVRRVGRLLEITDLSKLGDRVDD